MSSSCQKSSLRKWRNFTFQHSMRSSWRFEERTALDVQQFFVIEGSCRSRPALEELDGQQFFAIEGSCRRDARIGSLEPKLLRVASKSAGSSASPTPPFRRVRLR